MMWMGDFVTAYLLLSTFSISVLLLISDNKSTIELISLLFISILIIFVWSLKRFITPWIIVGETNWLVPSLVTFLLLLYCVIPWLSRIHLNQFRVNSNEKSNTSHT